MAELRNCPECGRLFAYVGRNLCPRCIEQEEEEFNVVRKYVREHPGATVIEISEVTGVEEDKILNFVKEGRLISRGLSSTAVFYCERCGTRIETGRYCRACALELDNALSQSIKALKKESPAVMEQPTQRGKERMHIRELKNSDRYK